MCITGVLKWYCPGCSKTMDTETKDRICEDKQCPYKTKSYRGPLPIADAQVVSSDPCKDCTEPKSGVHRSKSGSAAGSAAGRGSRESNSSRIYTINSDYQHFPSTYTSQRSERPEGSRGASGKSNTQQQSRRGGAGGESSRTREYIPTPSHADRDYLKVPSDDRRGGYGSGSSSHSRPNSSSSRRSGQDDNEPRDGETREDWYKRVTGSASGYRAYAERSMSGQGSSSGTYRAQSSGGRRDSAATVTPRSYPESMPPAYSSRGNGSAHGGSARHGESAYGGSGRGGSAHGGSRRVAEVRHGYASPAGSPPSYSQIYPSDSISSVGASSLRASSVGTSSVGSMSSFGGSSTASTSRRDKGIQIVINMG
ncbi:hypothetical protein LTR10_017656 [Elasticomyces elasticus]|uniref:Uncharacterized protein n=1 Tax=Exophiala sideris TaxID=1016849 RepID=A0ABR0JPZ5_9EURO|nr:hypothetical protein LTR10_017656 [Elasticomyces elasticus]KAK5038301.1 hypothetical protein LTS07_001771 [Exophiala sideris]KAK5044285.1 hypothetical protein LTR13_000641 [Exophiala sideris]KAK5067785.1 hypothetical protein LTR69_001774 [Exophiala sideris]KAK5183975.1 hypothetical protein LTR44_003480 [Eurotiomycetes sp. CCFEE 6388]